MLPMAAGGQKLPLNIDNHCFDQRMEDSMQKKAVLHLSEKAAWSCFLPSMTGTIVMYTLVYRVFGSLILSHSHSMGQSQVCRFH